MIVRFYFRQKIVDAVDFLCIDLFFWDERNLQRLNSTLAQIVMPSHHERQRSDSSILCVISRKPRIVTTALVQEGSHNLRMSWPTQEVVSGFTGAHVSRWDAKGHMFHPRVFKFKSEDLVYSVENNGRLDQLDFFIRAPDVSCQWPSVLARRLRHTLAAVLSISISEFIQFRIPVRPPACAPCTNGDGGQRSFGKMQKKTAIWQRFLIPLSILSLSHWPRVD